MTVASRGEGVAELLQTVEALEEKYRRGGEHARRRRQAYDLEVLDWALEILRPELLEKITKSGANRTGDPRLKAIGILKQL